MRVFFYAVTLVVAALMSVAAAFAQSMQAAVPAPATLKLYPGLTMKAVQSCPRFPGQGVTFTVESVNSTGTSGTASVVVECWGNWAIYNTGRYIGPIAIEGNSVTLNFALWWAKSCRADISGTVQSDQSGKPTLVFGRSGLSTGSEVYHYTPELIFRFR